MTEPIISLDKVYKSYLEKSQKWAVADFTLNIFPGEFFCLVGPSGCGKSTVLKIIADLEKPTKGTVQKTAHISMVFQSGALLPWLTVSENVEFGLKMKNTSKSQIKELSSKYLKMVGLENYYHKYPRELSGGQRQRVGIARALATETEVLLLDEPFSALDPVTTKELHQDLLKIWRETHKTIIMVSHLLEEAVLLADRVGIMLEGKLIKIVDIPLSRPRNEDREKFIFELNKVKKIIFA